MTESVTPKIFQVTWPVLIEQVLFILMGTADTFMLARVSSAAVAAVGAGNQVIDLILLVFYMISGGTVVIIAQYLGARRIEECAKYTGASITVNLGVGLFVSLLLVFLRSLIGSALQLSPPIIHLLNAYLLIVGSTIFVQALLGAVSSVLRCNGYTRITMFVSIGMNVVHIVGNYLFIFGALGVPKLGVIGVAISTSGSRLLAFGVLMMIMYRVLPYRVQWTDYIRIQGAHLKKILAIGIPSAGEPLAYDVGQLVMMGFMGVYGATVLATRIYSMNLMFYIATFGGALGFGTQIVVGHLCGAGKLADAYKQVWRTLSVAFSVSIVLAVAMALSGHNLFRMFTNDPAVIKMGTHLLYICIILEPGRTFNMVIIQSMRAAGDVRFPVLMGMIFPIGMGIPLSYFLGVHLHMGLAGVWWTICLDEWTRGIIMAIRWRSRVWQKNVIVKPMTPEVSPILP